MKFSMHKVWPKSKNPLTFSLWSNILIHFKFWDSIENTISTLKECTQIQWTYRLVSFFCMWCGRVTHGIAEKAPRVLIIVSWKEMEVQIACIFFFSTHIWKCCALQIHSFFKSLFFKTILTSHYTIMAQLLNVIINLTHPGANSNRPCQASEKAAGLGPFLPLFIIQCPGFSCFYLPLPALNSEPQLPGLGVFGHDSSLVIFHWL